MRRDSDNNRCQASRKDGAPCRGTPRASGWCWAHDPELQGQREEAWRLGGSHSAKSVRLARAMGPRLSPLFNLLLKSVYEVHDGKLYPRRALAMASLTSALLKTLEAGELEAVVAHLEDVLEKDR